MAKSAAEQELELIQDIIAANQEMAQVERRYVEIGDYVVDTHSMFWDRTDPFTPEELWSNHPSVVNFGEEYYG